MSSVWLLMLSLLLICTSLRASDDLELIFGLEEEMRSVSMSANFVKSMVVKNPNKFNDARNNKRREWIKQILKDCENYTTLKCKADIDSKDIFFYEADTQVGWLSLSDDAGVIEVKSKPFKLTELDSSFGKAIDLVLYNAAKKVGIKPAVFRGEGHIHIDRNSLFVDSNGKFNYLLYRNYLVDWANHSELYYGALHYDTKSFGARPLLETREKRANFQNWLKKYDDALSKEVLDEEILYGLVNDSKMLGFAKDNALNIFPRHTVEIRTLRPKKNLLHMKSVLTLLQARAQFLKNQAKPIPYNDARVIQNAQEGVNRFHRYVTESGLDWHQYSKLMPKTWQLYKPKVNSKQDIFKRGTLSAPKVFCGINSVLIHILNM